MRVKPGNWTDLRRDIYEKARRASAAVGPGPEIVYFHMLPPMEVRAPHRPSDAVPTNQNIPVGEFHRQRQWLSTDEDIAVWKFHFDGDTFLVDDRGNVWEPESPPPSPDTSPSCDHPDRPPTD